MSFYAELADELLTLADGLNQALGHPVCAVPCEHGGRCSLVHEHEGNHETHGRGGRVLCTWKVAL